MATPPAPTPADAPTPWAEQLEAVYREHHRGLLALAVSVTGYRQQAEDAVHEAFLRLCRRPRTLQGGLKPYVYAAVRNAAIDQHRRRRGVATQPPAGLFDAADPAPGPGDRAAHQEARHRLMRAIDQLESRDKQVVVLRVFGGLSLEEVATALDMPRSTVSSCYQRLLGRLRTELKPLAQP